VAKRKPKKILSQQADRDRDTKAKWARRHSSEGSEIGPPPPRNQELWDKYHFDLLAYLVERFPHSTGLKPFSKHHIRAIRRLQQAILEGDLQLWIVFRGWAKSTICENAATWAAGYGHRQFFVVLGADKDAAQASVDSIQSEFETNDLLMEIFPEACHAARALEGVPQRAGKQTIDGELTRIDWPKDHCVLPTVPGFSGSGAIIVCKGITANIRGLRFKRPDGKQVRPDFILCDDLQTDDSAASPSQVHKRLSKLNKTVLRLGGHDKKIACVVLGTIIEPDDMMDQLSNHKLYPAWSVEKVPMLKSFSKVHESHWLETYAELRTTHNSDDDDDKKRASRDATAFLEANWDVMHEGAEATWESCFIDGEELSAVQHAYNILIDTTEDAFMAECQNAPVRDTGGLVVLTAEQICLKQSNYVRDQFPAECTLLDAFVDVHPSILYWHVWAWEPRFAGYCINYGTFPDQRRKYFSHNQLSRRLQQFFPNHDDDATVTAAMDALLNGYEPEGWGGLLNREWLRGDGVPMRIKRCGIDANGEPADAVKKFIRQSSFASTLHPSYGRGVSAKQMPISQWKQSRGQNTGPEWVLTQGKPGDPQGVMHDTNYWLTRFHRGLSLPAGSQGSLYLFKAKPNDHRMVADSWASGKVHEVTVGSRTVYEWTEKPGTDNHNRDVAVGCMVGASREGISSVKVAAKKPRRSLAELAEMARSKR